MSIIQKYNPISGSFDLIHSEDSFDDITVVANYSALPAVATVTGRFYWASASQGTSWLPGSLGGTYYSKGMYYSNGSTWEFLDVPYQATLTEVNTGTNDNKFVTPLGLENSKYLNQNGAKLSATASGTDTYTATLTPAITSYLSTQRFFINFTNANTVTNPTLNLNGLGAKGFVQQNGAAINIGALNGIVAVAYNGTNFQILGRAVGVTTGTVASGLELKNLQARWSTIMDALIQVSNNVTANTYAMYSNSNLALPTAGSEIRNGNAVVSQPVLAFINSADYPSVNGIAPKLRIRVHIGTNATAPGCDFTFGLYPMTAPVSAGGAGAKSWTIGTVVTGSDGATQASPAANTHYQLVSGEFSLPSNGVYAICFTNSATTASNSYTELQAILQVSN